jgi:hypothetical protein
VRRCDGAPRSSYGTVPTIAPCPNPGGRCLPGDGPPGVGVDIRTSEHLALHPEVTRMRIFEHAQILTCVVGVGLNVGAMSNYSDMENER